MTDKIVTSIEDGILRVRFNRPDKKNALLPEMYQALDEAFDQLAEDKTCRVMLLEGSTEAFTAGNDVASFMAVRQRDPSAPNPTLSLMKKAATSKKPLIASVSGPAVGLGTTLLFSFDLVYASETAYFKTPFVDLGIVPEAGTTMLMPGFLGWHAAAEMLLTGDNITAERAREMGFVNKIVPAEELEETALAMARKLTEKPAAALRLTKELMKGEQSALLELIEREMRILAECVHSPETEEAVKAFMEKRPPNFKQFD